MFDLPSEAAELRVIPLTLEKRKLGATKRGIAGWLHDFRRKIDQAYSARAGLVHVVPKRAGQIQSLHIRRFSAPFRQQQLDRGSDGSLGQLQLSYVALMDRDRRSEHELIESLIEAAARLDDSELETGGHRIHEAAPAQTARSRSPKNVAVKPAAIDPYL